MNNKTLYYGSSIEIQKPIFNYPKPHNDYGLGFYCTENKEIAKEWSCVDDATNGIVNEYKLDFSDLKILNLTEASYNVLNWMALLVKNRTFDLSTPLAIEAKDFLLKNYLIDITQFDIIIGYRADDSYFRFAKDFINNSISVQKLSKALTLGNLGLQVVLTSQKAFNKLVFISSEIADHIIYYPKRKARDLKARKDYEQARNALPASDERYIIDIIRERKQEK